MTTMNLTTTINYTVRYLVFILFFIVSGDAGVSNDNVRVDMQHVHCLANAIHHESRGEPEEGQKAVAAVIINRSRMTNKSVC